MLDVRDKIVLSKRQDSSEPSCEALLSLLQSVNDDVSSLTRRPLEQSIEDRFLTITAEKINKAWVLEKNKVDWLARRNAELAAAMNNLSVLFEKGMPKATGTRIKSSEHGDAEW